MQTPFPIPQLTDITGLILAGGRASRLQGEDKGLILLAGKPLIAYTIERLAPQVNSILISANRNRLAYAGYGLPVFADDNADFNGPLAGMLAGLKQCNTPWLQCVPCDNPRLPDDLVMQLSGRILADTAIAVPRWQGRLQPVYSLLHRSLTAPLEQALKQGHYKVQQWVTEQPHVVVDFPDTAGFFNINTPQDLQRAAQP
ncbi:MAG: molybdenum cofactor guanylyltransferase [Gammaproteobacteria bacterium]|nr:molybdenum cofactor guanylyltransferase [Gammaproteobacteria bacterium]MDH5651026.1 molybdenum cofactor guanylyltransferase [Gammaproteobacteria bacterium]